MSKAQDVFERIVKIAQKVNSEHWVETGNNLPLENSCFVALFQKIEELENRISKLESVDSDVSTHVDWLIFQNTLYRYEEGELMLYRDDIGDYESVDEKIQERHEKWQRMNRRGRK